MSTAHADEFAAMDATAQAELVRKKQVKPIELVEAAIKRVERVNPELNAVITPMYEEAREAAALVSTEAPFAGVPFLLKDLLASYAGVRMCSGSRFLRDFTPNHDSELVRRFKAAGLITIRKNNTSEHGSGPTTAPARFRASGKPTSSRRTH